LKAIQSNQYDISFSQILHVDGGDDDVFCESCSMTYLPLGHLY